MINITVNLEMGGAENPEESEDEGSIGAELSAPPSESDDEEEDQI